MKTVKNVLVVALFLITFSNMASPLLGVDVLITSHEVFYFKVDKGWMGGEVEVIGEDAKQVSSQKLDKKKMMVDFYDLAPGTYTIIVKKADCDCHEEFIYIKE